MLKFTNEFKSVVLPGRGRAPLKITAENALLTSLFQPKIANFVNTCFPGDCISVGIDYVAKDNYGQPWLVSILCKIECTLNEILCQPLVTSKLRTL